jgi:hypothetical protein
MAKDIKRSSNDDNDDEVEVETQEYTVPATSVPEALTTGLAPEDYLTEQEKSGPDPVSAPVEPGPLVEPLTLGPREPYPTGNPPAPPAREV